MNSGLKSLLFSSLNFSLTVSKVVVDGVVVVDVVVVVLMAKAGRHRDGTHVLLVVVVVDGVVSASSFL